MLPLVTQDLISVGMRYTNLSERSDTLEPRVTAKVPTVLFLSLGLCFGQGISPLCPLSLIHLLYTVDTGSQVAQAGLELPL